MVIFVMVSELRGVSLALKMMDFESSKWVHPRSRHRHHWKKKENILLDDDQPFLKNNGETSKPTY